MKKKSSQVEAWILWKTDNVKSKHEYYRNKAPPTQTFQMLVLVS